MGDICYLCLSRGLTAMCPKALLPGKRLDLTCYGKQRIIILFPSTSVHSFCFMKMFIFCLTSLLLYFFSPLSS